MSNIYPRMMYKYDGSRAYRVVESHQEAEKYAAMGYGFERWEAHEGKVKPVKEPLPMPSTEAPKKVNKRKKPHHKSVLRRPSNASKKQETKADDGHSGASPGKATQEKQGSAENEQKSAP